MNQFKKTPFKRWIILLSLFVGISLSTFAVNVQIDGLNYELNTSKRTASVIGYTSDLAMDVVIPDSIEHSSYGCFKVTAIANRAFANCKVMESISIPPTITSIGTSVEYYTSNSSSQYWHGNAGKTLPFYNCTNLKSIIFKDGPNILSISSDWSSYDDGYYSKGAFSYCPVKYVYIGRDIQANVTYNYSVVKVSPFYKNQYIETVVIGVNVSSLPKYMFDKCNNLMEIICYAKNTPSVTTNSFSESQYQLAKLYILESNYNDYDNHAIWGTFNNKTIMFNRDGLLFIPQSSSTAAVSRIPDTNPTSLKIPSVVNYNGINWTVTSVFENAFRECDELTSVELSNSIKEIGNNAFSNNKKLSSVIFNGQTEIKSFAFANCPSLTNISFPDELKTIGERAFQGANSITQINFNDGLESIGASAFIDCNALTAVRLPNSVTHIGDSAFEDCLKLTYVSLGENLTSLGSSAFRNCRVLTEISIPGTTLTVGDRAFENCNTLALATLNTGITSIGAYCFAGCSELLSMTIPGSVKSIGEGSFNGCSSLASLTFTNSNEVITIPHFTDSPLKTLRIGRNLQYTYSDTDSPFRNRTTLKRVIFTGDNLTNIYNYLLDGCSEITSITLPESLISINEHAFRNCSSLSEITFPAALGNIGSHAFDGCSSIEKLTISNSESALTLGTDNSMFFDSPIKSLYVGRNLAYTVTCYADPHKHAPFSRQKELMELQFTDAGYITEIPEYFIYEAEQLPSLTLPSSLNSIGEFAFYSNSSIPSLTLPDDVTTVGQSAFQNCSMMESIHLSEKLSALNPYVLAGCTSLKSIIIPPSVTEIGTGAFNGDTSLTDVTIGDSEKTLTIEISSPGKGMFYDNPLKDVYIGRNLSYTSNAYSGYSPFKGLSTMQKVTFSQGGAVTQILPYLLNGCSSVKNFTLPESLASIGAYAFADMDSLENCVLPNSITALGAGAFRNDSLLASVVLSNRLPVLSSDLFSNCVVLDNLSIPASVTEIQNNVFTECISMKNLRIENGSEVMSVGLGLNGTTSMFRDCPIEKLHLGRWLTYDVNSSAYAPFEGQKNLTELTLGETVGTIGKYLFSNCSALPEVTIPNGVESIGEEGFYNCGALTRLTIGEGLTSLGEKAFARNISLDNVKMPSTLTAISDGCFSGCTGLVNLELNDGLEIIGPRAFENCSSLTSVDIPAKVYGLGVEAFQGCTSLSVVTIPEGSISSVGARAFKGCANVGWISLGSNVTSLGVNCFDGCSKVGHIKSYNTIPPVGSPGFPQNVIDNGTVFVPADAVQDYNDSDTWWEFFQIRPMTDGEFITSITLNRTEATIRDTETLNISATASPDNATDNTVLFRSSDTSVATVDNTGLISGKKPGDVIITAYAADGSGIYATCAVKVTPTLVERIEGKPEISIKVGRSADCEATVYPENATDRSISWKSDNSSAVKVNENGTLTAVYDGTANVTATANDGSGVTFTFRVNVVPPTTGDSNDDDRVTITDAVNTANYAVGITPEVFVFRAADVNGDNRISLADASGTVAIVLDQPVLSAMRRVHAKTGTYCADNDILAIEDFNISAGEAATIAVRLDGTRDYVAMQGDIIVPDGLRIVGITTGARTAACHTVATKRLENGTVRFAIFDINNNAFEDNDEAILNIAVMAEKAVTSDLAIVNILGSDADAKEHMLTSAGGHNNAASGISDVDGGSIRIESAEDGIRIYNAEGSTVVIVAPDGTTISRFTANSAVEHRNLVPGIYVVTAGEVVKKVIVK